ncbi:FHA domain-containing protein, partial [Frankia sp. R82]|uniref:FHA domain-containing protein n=1 Tax=Frankia sp. R82 TaxID=2950553 RepID=UPI002044603C
MSTLRIIAPSGEAVLEPERDHVVGRGRDCDVVISDGRVSRRHLRLESTADGWLARDISSSGIWVDGSRAGVVPLRGGEVRLRLGAADGPSVTLIPPPPPAPVASAQEAAPGEPDLTEQETMLAGSGAPTAGRPRPPANPVPP